jgi:hypothetical protein
MSIWILLGCFSIHKSGLGYLKESGNVLPASDICKKCMLNTGLQSYYWILFCLIFVCFSSLALFLKARPISASVDSDQILIREKFVIGYTEVVQ